MNKLRFPILLALIICVFLLGACQPLPESDITYDAANLQFSGEQALALEEAFVTQFPYRASGMPNVEPGTQWLKEQFESYGLVCTIDEWRVINYSKPVPLRNVICRLPGSGEQEIVLMAHHDQSPETIYGADNDGSGISIMLHLAQLFAAEPPGPHSVVFVATDGEEYGMLGSRRLAAQHPDPQKIVAAVSLDNLGKYFYDGLDMAPIGQYDSYGPAWLLQTALDTAAAAAATGDDTIIVPRIRPPFDQVIDQAVPISLMDQGPMVAIGVPAFGFSHTRPPEFDDFRYETFHSEKDTMELQSAANLQGAGRATEALIRHLQTIDSFPQGSAPYLYDAGSRMLLDGPFLWLIFALFVAIFFGASIFIGRRSPDGLVTGWSAALPHFLGLWLPLILAILSLYLMTAVGLLGKFDTYFATQKDPVVYAPRWPAIFLFLVGLAFFLYVGRRIAARLQKVQPDFKSIKSLSFLVIGLATLYIAIFNPFSLLLTIPLLLWLLISGRRGLGFALDIILFILGFSLLFYLFYTFGVVILRIDWLILWYVMMMMAVPMVGFFTMSVIVAMVGAGLSMVVHPPVLATETSASTVEAIATD